MHEEDKLKEAYHFFNEMTNTENDRAKFEFNLSAFLSASRSVMQYMENEARSKGEQAWYLRLMKTKVMQHFRDTRDTSIHENPVKPNATVSAGVVESVGFTEGFAVSVSRDDETILEQSGTSTEPPPKFSPPEMQSIYHFNDWAGPENVLQLSLKYLSALELAVRDGQKKGFLTK